MRVAFVDQVGGKPGGAEESLALLLAHLPTDITPSIILFEDGEFAQRMRERGYATHVIPVSDRLRAVKRERLTPAAIAALPAAVAKVARLLGCEPFDLVHTNTVKAHLIAAPAARIRRIRAVMHLRDMVAGPGRAALVGVASACTRERIAISHALSHWYALPRTTVIANPVDLSAYASIPQRQDARRELGIPVDDLPLIGIVGRINRWKGHDRFLRIAAAVNAIRPVRCAIIGEARFRDADFVPELHRLAHDLGLRERTTFVPWLNDPRIAYAALDLHCNCSEREPFGRSIVEAAAAGVPSVAFNDGGATDIIRDGIDGKLIPPGDESAFALAIVTLLGDETTRNRTSAAARAGSSRFAAQRHAQLVAEILRRSCV